MRQMKFRAWHKTLKRWLSYEEFYIDGTGRIFTTQYSEMGEPHTDISDDVELVQFTGLLDKNGKEIYEGDIVQVSNEDGEQRHGGVVKYIAPKFFVMDGEKSGLFLTNKYEVIGNIYEHGHLLDNTDTKV